MQVHWPKSYCPFGCHNADPQNGLESDFDVNGYCKHVAGMLNMAPGMKPLGKFFETLEPIFTPVYDEADKPIVDEVKDPKTGEIKMVPRVVHSGAMRCNGRRRQQVLPTDVVASPEQLQREMTITEITQDATGGTHEIKRVPRLGIAGRVYRKDANTAVIVKLQEEDPAAEKRAKADTMMVDAEELLRQAAEIDRLRTPSDVDEVAQAEAATKAEHKRMKDKEPAAT